MAVGFQLSYIAVVSIVYFHPLLYNLLEPDSRFLDQIWNISAVSMAAQLGTFAIGLFYFHQFPTYFLISNLFVIPLAFSILVGGLIVIALHGVPILGEWSGILVEAIIRLLNFLIFFVEKIPFALVNNISLTLAECIFMAALVVTVTLFIQFRKFHFAIFSLVLLIALGISQWVSYGREFVRPRMVVYQVSKHLVLDLIRKGTAYCLSDIPETNAETVINYQVSPNRLALGVRRIRASGDQPFFRKFGAGAVVRWEGKTILVLTERPHQLDSIVVDYLVLSGSATRDLAAVLKKIRAHNVILDSSNSYFVTDKALKSLTETVQIHSVWHHGAFEVNW